MVVVLVVAVIALAGGGGGGSAEPPASGAARLVPADALVYVHLSTDADRAADARRGEGRGGVPVLQGAARRDRLAPAGAGLRRGDQGAEDRRRGGAGDLRHRRVVAGQLARAGGHRQGPPGRPAAGVRVAVVDLRRDVPGDRPAGVAERRGQAAEGGRKGSLAQAAGPKKELAALPEDRVADGWLSADGLRRLLAPQGGLLGAAGVLFDQATLKGAAFGVQAKGDRVTLTVKSQLDSGAEGVGRRGVQAVLADAGGVGAGRRDGLPGGQQPGAARCSGWWPRRGRRRRRSRNSPRRWTGRC